MLCCVCAPAPAKQGNIQTLTEMTKWHTNESFEELDLLFASLNLK